MNKKISAKHTMPYVFLMVIVFGVLLMASIGNTKYNNLKYDELLSELSAGTVKTITTSEHKADGVYYITGKLESYKKNEFFRVNAPLSETVQETLTAYQNVNEFEWKVDKNPENASWLLIVMNVLPMVIIILSITNTSH